MTIYKHHKLYTFELLYKKICAFLLVLSFVLPIIIPISKSRADEPTNIISDEAVELPLYKKYEEIMGVTESGETGFLYSDEMLICDENEYSTDLVKASVVLAAAGYEIQYVNAFLSRMGYEPRNFQFEDNRTITSNDTVAFTVGRKYNSEHNATLWCIVVRGTKENDEWFSNFNLGHGDTHWGFAQASLQAIVCLDNLVSQYGTGKNIFWFTGHSRGAAIANLMAADYTHSGNKVFGYTFACPAVSKKPDNNLNNIYNINNTGDIVPILPLEEWGYGRHGITKKFSFSNEPVFQEIYLINNQTKYDAPANNITYRRILRTIVPYIYDYYDPIRHFGIMLLAAYFAGYDINLDTMELVLHTFVDDNADIVDFIAAKGLKTLFDEIVKYVGDGLVEIVKFVDILGLFKPMNADSIARQLEEYINFTISALETTVNYSEEEFDQYYNENLIAMMEITDFTGVKIKCRDDLLLAYEELTHDNDYSTETEKILSCVFDLLSQVNDPFASFRQGHYHGVYIQYINQQYFGYKGRKGSSITSVTIPSDITSIGTNCFLNCNQLQNVTIPESVKVLGQGVFFECKALSRIEFPSSIQFIPIGCCFGCSSLKSLDLPETVLEIGNQAFGDCNKIASVTIPNSVKEIGQQAFGGCNNIEEVTIPVALSRGNIISSPKIRKIHYTVNEMGTDLKDRVDNRNDLNWGMFTTMEYLSMSTLEEVIFDEGITRIGDYAFYGSYNGGPLSRVILPSTLKSIGKNAFSGQDSIESMSAISENATIETGVVFPDGLERIGNGCFCRCDGIKKVIFPDSITDIGNIGFSYCSSLKEVEFLGNVNSIGDNCFEGCWYLESAIFAGNVNQIGDYAFHNCENLAEFQIPNGLTAINDWLLAGCHNIEEINIPATVTSIGMGAFSNTGVSTITIPDTVVDVGEYAFAYCQNLTEAHLSEGMTIMQFGMFDDCKNLSNIYIPSSIVEIGNGAFRGTGVNNLDFIPATVNSIGEEAFEMCENLETIVIPSNISRIKRQAFSQCENLISVTLPNTIDTIDRYCFAFCNNLREINIPESIQTIEWGAFNGCSSLDLLIIPDSVTSIGSYAFSDCKLLNSLLLSENISSIGENAFESTPQITVYCYNTYTQQYLVVCYN